MFLIITTQGHSFIHSSSQPEWGRIKNKLNFMFYFLTYEMRVPTYLAQDCIRPELSVKYPISNPWLRLWWKTIRYKFDVIIALMKDSVFCVVCAQDDPAFDHFQLNHPTRITFRHFVFLLSICRFVFCQLQGFLFVSLFSNPRATMHIYVPFTKTLSLFPQTIIDVNCCYCLYTSQEQFGLFFYCFIAFTRSSNSSLELSLHALHWHSRRESRLIN